MVKLLTKIKEIITILESNKIPFHYFILTFFFAITLRYFLEIFSDEDAEILLTRYSHYYLFGICLAFALIILFYFATKEKIEKISRVILPSFLILISVPILDLILSLGKGYNVAYMQPGIHKNMLLRFFTFFGPFNGIGITPGMRIEITLVIIASFLYFLIKKQSIIRSLIFSLLTYSLIFISLAMPFVYTAFLKIFGLEATLTELSVRNFYLLLIFILGIWLFYLYNKRYFIEIIKDIRPFRLLHFELMFILGIVLAKFLFSYTIQLTQDTLLYWFLIIVAILFAWLFSVITNNMVDYDIDKITNKTRPSVSKKIPIEHYKKISWIFLIFAIVYSSAVNFITLFLILLFIGNYFLYSMPPFRLKRIPFFSKLFISLNSLVLVILGYSFVTEELNIPWIITAFFLIGFTAVINFIDIKDYRGDKEAGIKTIPTIFGLRKSKIIIGSFFLFLYPLTYFIIKKRYLIIPLIILGIIQFFLINRKNYSEKPVFIVYLASIIMLIILMMV